MFKLKYQLTKLRDLWKAFESLSLSMKRRQEQKFDNPFVEIAFADRAYVDKSFVPVDK